MMHDACHPMFVELVRSVRRVRYVRADCGIGRWHLLAWWHIPWRMACTAGGRGRSAAVLGPEVNTPGGVWGGGKELLDKGGI